MTNITHITDRERAQAAEIERLTKAQQWHPIETAPSDVVVLLYTPHIHESNQERVEARVYHDSRAGSWHGWATHWMPLPPPPTQKDTPSPDGHTGMITAREAFENWYSNDGQCPQAVKRANNGDYMLTSAYMAWKVWQAAWDAGGREALADAALKGQTS